MALVDVTRDGRIATVTLNRPDKLNALTREMDDLLLEAFQTLGDDGTCHVIILRGNGASFCAGHDLVELGQREHPFESEILNFHQSGLDAMTRWFTILGNLPQPVVGEVQGHCINYGLELAMNCDVVIAADDAKLASRPLGGMRAYYHLWPWLIGLRKMREIAFTRPTISGTEAAEMGMINRSVPLAELRSTVQALAEQIAAIPLEFLALEKQAIWRCYEAMGMHAGLKASGDLAALAHTSITAAKTRDLMRDGGWREGLSFLERETGRSGGA